MGATESKYCWGLTMKKFGFAAIVAMSLLQSATFSLAQGAATSGDCALVGGVLESPILCLAYLATLPATEQTAFWASLPIEVKLMVADIEGFGELGLAAGSDEIIPVSPAG
jgi:hypothetical protein